MEIVSEGTHRVLAYIDALNRHGVKPPALFVDRFAVQPEPRKPRVTRKSLVYDMTALSALLYRDVVEEGDKASAYMMNLGWVQEADGLELTRIGRALLKSLNAPVLEDTTADVFEIVLSPDDPFAYAQAIAALTSVPDALLVEPYLRLPQLMDIADFDNISRVLVGSKLGDREYGLLAHGLATLAEDRPLEIRRAKELHDRYLIPRVEGSVLMLGMSLGGIGKKVSTLTTLGDVASGALRSAHEDLWKEADVIEPRRPTGSSAEASTAEPAANAGVKTAKGVAKKTSASPRKDSEPSDS